MSTDLPPLQGPVARWWAAGTSYRVEPPIERPMRARNTVPAGQQRVCDRDRQRTVDRLSYAHAIGMLDGDEYEERTNNAWNATTRDDLEPLTADLTRADDFGESATDIPDAGRESLRGASVIWACASVFSIVVWGLLCVLGQRLAYPGFIWVVVPCGSVLAVLWLVYGHRRAAT